MNAAEVTEYTDWLSELASHPANVEAQALLAMLEAQVQPDGSLHDLALIRHLRYCKGAEPRLRFYQAMEREAAQEAGRARWGTPPTGGFTRP